ncbi:MAG TPA: OB-fold domain-containing protein [Galbitalea sp.]|nr:OB-fold domain-containing protein [Galbitalea sp.]
MTRPKPLPDIEDPLTAPFWAMTRESRLGAQRCGHCGALRWPPRPICPECQTPGGEWVELRPSGTLWSFAAYYRALDPSFKEDLPYAVGLIELDDGPRMYGKMVGDPEALVIGQRVHALFTAVAPEIALVEWERDGDAPDRAFD